MDERKTASALPPGLAPVHTYQPDFAVSSYSSIPTVVRYVQVTNPAPQVISYNFNLVKEERFLSNLEYNQRELKPEVDTTGST